jgi:hypothetical protein
MEPADLAYDPLFRLPELDQTMPEIGLGTKQRLSHRGRALEALLREICDRFAELSPQTDDQAAGDDQCSAQQDSRSGKSAEKQIVGDLKDDEERGHVHAGDGGELDGSEVQRGSIGGEQRRAQKEQAAPHGERYAMDGDAYNGISKSFKDGRGEHEEKNLHVVMLSGVLSANNKKRELLPFFECAEISRRTNFSAPA